MTKKTLNVKRIIHGNNSITINTKGVPKDVKNSILQHIQSIEDLLNKETLHE